MASELDLAEKLGQRAWISEFTCYPSQQCSLSLPVSTQSDICRLERWMQCGINRIMRTKSFKGIKTRSLLISMVTGAHSSPPFQLFSYTFFRKTERFRRENSHVDEFEIAYPDYDNRTAETANGIAFISGALTPTSEHLLDSTRSPLALTLDAEDRRESSFSNLRYRSRYLRSHGFPAYLQ